MARHPDVPPPLPRVASLIAALALISLTSNGRATTAGRTSATDAPTYEQLRNATYRGIIPDIEVTLVNGRWQGPPAPGNDVSRYVVLAPKLRLVRDLDGDGAKEAVVLLGSRRGTQGEDSYIAVMSLRDNRVVTAATAFVGPMQLMDARLGPRRIELDVLQPGPKDPSAFPGDMVTRTWVYRRGALHELRAVPRGRLSIRAVAGTEWVLRSIRAVEPVPSGPPITLKITGGRLTGSAGCNRYSAEYRADQTTASLVAGFADVTDSACADSVMKVERRFLDLLHRSTGYGFLATQLVIRYQKDGWDDMMLFERRRGK